MTEQDKSERATLQRKAYGNAQARLRTAHRDEFNTFMAQEAKALGIEWKPRPTEVEKAAAELDALLAAHPELRERVAPTGGTPLDLGENEPAAGRPTGRATDLGLT